MSLVENSWSFVAYSAVKSYTREEAILEASKWGLEDEVTYLIDKGGYSPNEALAEWDIL